MGNKSLSITNENLGLISKSIDNKYTPGVINTIIKTSFPTLETVEQAVVAFQLATQYDLDPKMKEMFAWVDNRGSMICIASAMGFMKIARRQPGFIKIESHAVYEGEHFEMDTGTGEVSHKISPSKRVGKKPIGAYSKLEMEGKDPQVKFVNWTDYYVKKNYDSAWDKQSDALIEKCSATVLCRQAFGLSGLYGQEETENLRDGGDTKKVVIDSNPIKLEKSIADREAKILGKQDKTEKLNEMGKEAEKDEKIVEGEVI